MPLVNAKCTNCGANLQVDNTKDAAICQYCGSAYIVEKAINNYNTVNNINANVVNIYGGSSADFVIRAGVLEKYNGAATHVVIPDSVHRIDGKAFTYCYGLKKVDIPDTVNYIGGWVFKDCNNLEEINIPYGVTYIGARAFENCVKLKKVIIPNSVEEISINAFRNCSSLTSIVIPDSVSIISEGAFSDCGALQKVTLPKRPIVIPNRMFANCTNLTSIFIPSGTTISNPGSSSDDYYEGAFYGCSKLTDVIAEDSNLTLPEYALRDTPWFERNVIERQKEQRENWRKSGLCDLCGGKFKGLIVKKCSRCGNNRRY